MDIHNCKTSIIRKLVRSVKWRISIDARYPDKRNVPAAYLLEKVATEAEAMNDAQWRELRPFFVNDVNGSAWDVALTTTCRSVGYQGNITDLSSFIGRLVRVLRDPRTFAVA